MLTNENNWILPEPAPEPIPKPTPKKRGVLFLSPEDMQEAQKSMKEKGIKAEDVKNSFWPSLTSRGALAELSPSTCGRVGDGASIPPRPGGT